MSITAARSVVNAPQLPIPDIGVQAPRPRMTEARRAVCTPGVLPALQQQSQAWQWLEPSLAGPLECGLRGLSPSEQYAQVLRYFHANPAWFSGCMAVCFRLAAQAGHRWVQCDMGFCYEQGLGVPRHNSQSEVR